MMPMLSSAMVWISGWIHPPWLTRGYIGLGLATPVRGNKAGKASRGVKGVNRFINSRRAVVERVIAQVKTWRVVHTGFRRPLGVYGRVFAVVRGLVFLAAGGAFE